MQIDTWLIYLLAATGLSLTPGPNSLLALSHGALHGHRRTLLTIAGGTVGFVLLMALSMAGIGALLKASADALAVMKLVGGAYLIWLGVQLWRAPPLQLELAAGTARIPGARLFMQGFLAAASNPKVLLFYGAFLPQFIDPSRPIVTQFAIMAASFAVVEALVEYLLARLAHRVRPMLRRAGRRFNRACGGLFMLLGAALPISR
ncbi:MAG: LysE family transporter [Zoogloeaceae bacterium]|nr:LysE family transporter [Rhodocyclaceae bacterium]MCP5236932.1 LysE family transporter [Zoogloeaceae bacterium]